MNARKDIKGHDGKTASDLARASGNAVLLKALVGIIDCLYEKIIWVAAKRNDD